MTKISGRKTPGTRPNGRKTILNANEGIIVRKNFASRPKTRSDALQSGRFRLGERENDLLTQAQKHEHCAEEKKRRGRRDVKPQKGAGGTEGVNGVAD